MHPTDYAPCQALADTARAAGVDAIRYLSVRDPRGGMNVALLHCRAFSKLAQRRLQSWHIHLSAAGAHAICEAPKSRITFGRQAFAADPRIARPANGMACSGSVVAPCRSGLDVIHSYRMT